MELQLNDIIDGKDFRNYIEEKYRGVRIVDPKINFEIIVENIKDLKFEDLTFEEQKICVRPDVGWGWGVTDTAKVEDSTEIKGYLFRPKQRAYWWGLSKYPFYCGAFGSGKSLLLWLFGIYLCLTYPGTRGVFMRATYPQLKTTSLPTFFKIMRHFGWREGVHYRHHMTDHKISFIGAQGELDSEIQYLAAKGEGQDIQAAIEDLQSLEIDFALVDELNGINEKIYFGLSDRIGRWGEIPNPVHRKLCAGGNPPMEGSWIHKRWYLKKEKNDKPLKNPQEYSLSVSSSYENKRNLPPDYIEGLEARPEWYRDTFLYGRLGFQPPDGEPVYGEFNYDLYVSDVPLKAHEGLPIIRGWDLGPQAVHKAAILAQIDPAGVLLILAEITQDAPGIKPFVEYVIQQTNALFPEVAGEVKDFSDPVALHTSQTDNRSAADVARECGVNFIPGEERLELRIDSVVQVMTRLHKDGRPGLYIDPLRCPTLLKGFMGGYRYKTIDEGNQRHSLVPVKDIYSHTQDALQYLCSRLGFAKYDRSKNRDKIYQRNPELLRKRQRFFGPKSSAHYS